MQQIPPPQLPWHTPGPPATPTVIPTLPIRVEQPGRHAPLPDAVAVQSCPVPATAPPFDDEWNGAMALAADRPPGDDLATPDPAGPDPADSEPRDSEPRDSEPRDSDRDESDHRRRDPPAGWPSQFAQVLAEALAGSRPAQQLAPWTTEQARRRIRQLGPLLATGQRPTVRRVMTSAPAANVLEMTAVVGFGPRVRVLALRLELGPNRAYRQGGNRWCCTAIESA